MRAKIAGGSDKSAGRGDIFFHEIQRPFRWVPDVRWRNHYFARNKEAFPCVRPWTQLSASLRTVHFRWMLFVDHVDHAAPRAPGRWTTARPRKGTTRRQGRLGSCFPCGGEYDCMRVCWFVCRRQRITAGVGLWVSRGMARPAMRVRWGGEACAAAEPVAGRREQAVPPALV